MEVVAQALPVPIGRSLVPEVLVDARAFARHALVRARPCDHTAGTGIPRGYLSEPPAPTGLLVDVYG